MGDWGCGGWRTFRVEFASRRLGLAFVSFSIDMIRVLVQLSEGQGVVDYNMEECMSLDVKGGVCPRWGQLIHWTGIWPKMGRL
jgi:hypothetical protein